MKKGLLSWIGRDTRRSVVVGFFKVGELFAAKFAIGVHRRQSGQP